MSTRLMVAFQDELEKIAKAGRLRRVEQSLARKLRQLADLPPGEERNLLIAKIKDLQKVRETSHQAFHRRQGMYDFGRGREGAYRKRTLGGYKERVLTDEGGPIPRDMSVIEETVNDSRYLIPPKTYRTTGKANQIDSKKIYGIYEGASDRGLSREPSLRDPEALRAFAKKHEESAAALRKIQRSGKAKKRPLLSYITGQYEGGGVGVNPRSKHDQKKWRAATKETQALAQPLEDSLERDREIDRLTKREMKRVSMRRKMDQIRSLAFQP